MRARTFSLRSASLTGRATATEGLGIVVSDMVTGRCISLSVSFVYLLGNWTVHTSRARLVGKGG
jgi:hypothetical protein